MHYFAHYTNDSLSKIFINSIKYLKACIYARYCLEKFELTPQGDLGMNSLTEASLTLLANFSSIKTLKNQLSRKESPIFLIKLLDSKPLEYEYLFVLVTKYKNGR